MPQNLAAAAGNRLITALCVERATTVWCKSAPQSYPHLTFGIGLRLIAPSLQVHIIPIWEILLEARFHMTRQTLWHFMHMAD